MFYMQLERVHLLTPLKMCDIICFNKRYDQRLVSHFKLPHHVIAEVTSLCGFRVPPLN